MSAYLRLISLIEYYNSLNYEIFEKKHKIKRLKKNGILANQVDIIVNFEKERVLKRIIQLGYLMEKRVIENENNKGIK